jgi:hypothetical protein
MGSASEVVKWALNGKGRHRAVLRFESEAGSV